MSDARLSAFAERLAQSPQETDDKIFADLANMAAELFCAEMTKRGHAPTLCPELKKVADGLAQVGMDFPPTLVSSQFWFWRIKDLVEAATQEMPRLISALADGVGDMQHFYLLEFPLGVTYARHADPLRIVAYSDYGPYQLLIDVIGKKTSE